MTIFGVIAPLLTAAVAADVQPEPVNWLHPEGLTAIATCALAVIGVLGLISLFLLRRQLILLKNQIEADHERSRREVALDLLKAFAWGQDQTNHEVTFGIAFLNSLNGDQCHSLWKREPFDVIPQQRELLKQYRTVCSNTTTGDGLVVSEIFRLRHLATSLLNRLEAVANAWHNNIADRSIIEQEFVKVFRPRDGIYILETYRAASGIYPSIEKICEFYRHKLANLFEAKPPTG